MNTSTIISSLVTILDADAYLNTRARTITDEYIEVPYLKGTYINIYVTSGEVGFHTSQPMNIRRYILPVTINIDQRKAKMSDSEVELNAVIDRILIVLDDNRKKITGVNGIADIGITRESDSTDVETRLTNIELMLDIIEER